MTDIDAKVAFRPWRASYPDASSNIEMVETRASQVFLSEKQQC